VAPAPFGGGASSETPVVRCNLGQVVEDEREQVELAHVGEQPTDNDFKAAHEKNLPWGRRRVLGVLDALDRPTRC